jgi:benzoylformate decarboxylase
MPVMSGKRAFLELLKQEGIEILFGNPGTTELPLQDALAVEPGLRYVLALQEASVLAMADGYAQASGKLAFANLHIMPGLGNAMGMLYDAKMSNTPLLVTAGQHDQSFTFSEPILNGDLVELARPLVKWATEVRRLEDLPRAVHRAAKVALTPPTGPVFLSLPVDVLNAEADIPLGTPTRVGPRLRGDAQAIAQAADLIAKAERPLIIAGDAVAQSHAHAELVALAELLGAGVYAEGIPNTASFPTSHPLFKGTFVRLAPAIRKVLEQHDLLLSIGGDLFTMSLPSPVEPVPEGMKLIHLDNNPWELGKNYPATVAIFGDPQATLPELTQAVAAKLSAAQKSAARDRLEKTKAEVTANLAALRDKAKAATDATPIQPLALHHAISELLPKNAVIVDESVSSSAGLRQFLKSDDPQSFFGLRGGGIGWGLPAAIGIKLALPDRPVVALVGDGSAMYTCQALWTAAHDHVPVTFIILNNSSYRILKQRTNAMKAHAAQTDVYVGMDLVAPRVDYVGLARSLGIQAERADTVAGVCALLKTSLAGKEPLLIDAEIDRAWKPA